MSRTVQHFDTLGPAFSALRDAAHRKSFSMNEMILKEGEPSDAVYVIESGCVGISLGARDGARELEPMEPGTYFGDYGVIDGRPRSASAIALEDTILRVIEGDVFRRCANQHPQKLLEHIIMRNRELTEDSRILATGDAYLLLVSALRHLPRRPDDQAVSDRLPTRRTLGRRIGASREWVGRILLQLRRNGYIQIDGSTVVFLRELPNTRRALNLSRPKRTTGQA